jgi:putative peptidoglycan lipid II flippase
VTLYGGMLNAVQRFASPAAAPIMLNLSMMVTLALAAFFPSAGHAAAWGVLIAGFLEALLVGADQARRDGLPRFRAFTIDADTKRFFKALGPATLGSAGLQIALFADTIIATFLPAGALSALYYADRLNQLPIGVIGIAAGTVVLPEMASRIAAGDEPGARHAQDRAIELTLLMSVPFLVAFLLVPDRIMSGLFSRGAFTAADAAAAGATLAAYAIGLVPFVLIRSFTATFLARGDTATPVKALLVSVVVNVACKVALMGTHAQVGLALATAIGAWVNFALVVWFAVRAGLFVGDARLRLSTFKLLVAGLALALALLASERWLDVVFGDMRRLRAEAELATLACIGGIVYGAAVAALFGRRWLREFRSMRPPSSASPAGDA